MKELLKKYEEKAPEIVFHWNDPETEAEGWTVINSLRGGAAGGGTRMRPEFFDTLNSIGNIPIALAHWEMTGLKQHKDPRKK